jgi:hypothetical protein
MAMTGKVRKSVSAPKPTRQAEGLTCDENQVEDLLSEGESTDAERDGNGRSKQTKPRKTSPR